MNKTKKPSAFKRFTALMLVFCLILTLFSGCGSTKTEITKEPVKEGNSESFSEGSELKELSDNEKLKAVVNKAGTTTSKKEYTIMIYMVGSDLESNHGLASTDIMEMLGSGIDMSKCNVVIYTGGSYSWDIGIPADVNSVFAINAYGNDLDYVAATSSALNMGDPSTFLDFLNFAYDSYPAEHYGLICWDHGGGSIYGYGSDLLYQGDSLLLMEMESAFEASPFKNHKLDFLGFDACLMANIETAEMADGYAKYLIASEESEPGTGWDYSALNIFNSTSDTKVIAQEIIDKYSDSIRQYRGLDYTLSCFDLSKYLATVNAMNSLFSKLALGVTNGDYSNIAKARNNTLRFGATNITDPADGFDMVDMMDFAEKLGANYKTEADELKSALRSFVAINSANMQGAGGVAMYFPYDNKNTFNLVSDAWGSDFYKIISDSVGYHEFVKAFSNIWINGEAQADFTSHQVVTEPSVAPTPTPTPTPTAAPTATPEPTPTAVPTPESQPQAGSLSVQLTNEQSANLSSAYYTIFELSTDSATGKSVYRPVLKNIKAEPDASGLISIPLELELMLLKTDLSDEAVIWPVSATGNGTNGLYITLDSYLMATNDTIGGMESIQAVLVDDGFGGVILSSVLSTENSNYGTYSKSDIDINNWNYIANNYKCYYPTYNASHVLYPYHWWDDNGVDSYSVIPYDEEFTFEKEKIYMLDGDFYYQIVLEDTSGNLYGTEIARFPKGQLYKEVMYDNALYRVYDSYAVLYEYYGNAAKVTIPDDIEGVPVKEIADYAFYYNTDLTELVLGTELEKIGVSAFSGCRNLSVVIDIGKNLRYIESGAFERCQSLANFPFPQGLCSIGNQAFANSGLVTVNLPDSLYHIGDGAFSACPSLYGFLINGDTNGKSVCFKVINSVLFSGTGSKLIAYPTASAASYNIPEGVLSIAPYAFAGATQLTKVTFPASLSKIESYAFYDCNNLQELNLPQSLRHIGHGAFASHSVSVNNESPIKTINIGPKVEFIGYDAFDSFPVTEFRVDSGNDYYSSINGCLLNKSGTAFIKAPYMLSGTLDIPMGVNEIKWHALSQCDLITALNIPDSVVSIDEDIGSPDSLTKISIGAALMNFGNISDCHYYTDISISANNPYLVYKDDAIFSSDMSILYYTKAKETVTVPEGVIKISETAFCPKTGRNTVTKVINLPASLDLIEGKPFVNLYELTDINVASGNGYYQSENGLLYSNNFALLHHCPQGKTGSVTVNSKVVTIYENAFYYSCKAEKVIVPEGVAAIRRGNFISHGGEGVMELVLPASLTEIYPKMLRSADKFKVTAPSGSAAAKHAEFMGVK